MHEVTRTLRTGFLRSAEQFPDRPALEVEGKSISYREMSERARAIAATLQKYVPSDDPPLTAVYGLRSETAFTGVVASLFRGHGYVPLNPQFPVDRTRKMLERSGCRALIVDRTAAKQLEELLTGYSEPLLLLFTDDAS